MSDRRLLGVEFQTAFCMPPVELVHLAADLGCGNISMVAAMDDRYNPYGFEPFSLRDDAELRRRTIDAMAERSVAISLGEGFVVRPGAHIRDKARDLEVMAELGVTRVNVVTMDPDIQSSFDQFGMFVEMAAAHGMETTMEFARSLTVTDLDTALKALQHVGRPDFRLLIDTMHVVRSGNTAAELAALDPSLIGYVQLSDHTLHQQGAVYREDSSDRMVPGEGEMPLADILAALPAGLVIGVEVPMRSKAEAGDTAEECVRRAVHGARGVLATVSDGR